jgi:hypothetical protein
MADGSTFRIGSTFSPDAKGLVIGQIIIYGFAAAIGFWFSTTAGEQKAAEATSRIAERAPEVAAAVVAAASAPADLAVPVKDMNVEVSGDLNVQGDKK